MAESLKLEPRGLVLTDAAAYSGTTVWFLRSAIWAGRLKARRAGKRLIILRDDLDVFLDSLPAVEPIAAARSKRGQPVR